VLHLSAPLRPPLPLLLRFLCLALMSLQQGQKIKLVWLNHGKLLLDPTPCFRMST
jgi:hypothetical protein